MVIIITLSYKTLLLCIIFLSGDIELNPGLNSPVPPQYPCSVCRNEARDNDPAIFCDQCHMWTHSICGNVIAMNNFSAMIHLSGHVPRVNYPTDTVHCRCQRALQVQMDTPRPHFNANRQHKSKNKVKVCVINENGLKGTYKTAAFRAFLHTEQPDVILGQ